VAGLRPSHDLPKVIHADDIRVIQPGQGFGFTRETLGETRIMCGIRLDDF
jgi:hypothetical protein